MTAPDPATDIRKLAQDVIEKAEKGTPRPWATTQGERVQIDFPTLEEYANSLSVYSKIVNYSVFGLIPNGIVNKHDAIYIVASANAAPQLAAEVIRQAEEIERLRAAIKDTHDPA